MNFAVEKQKQCMNNKTSLMESLELNNVGSNEKISFKKQVAENTELQQNPDQTEFQRETSVLTQSFRQLKAIEAFGTQS